MTPGKHSEKQRSVEPAQTRHAWYKANTVHQFHAIGQNMDAAVVNPATLGEHGGALVKRQWHQALEEDTVALYRQYAKQVNPAGTESKIFYTGRQLTRWQAHRQPRKELVVDAG